MIKKVVAGENDLQTLYPTVVEEWSYEKNGDTMPSSIYPGTHTKYWWKCRQCGHEWETAVRDRVRGRNCPECAKKQRVISSYKTKLATSNNLAIVRPDLAMEWNFEKNYPLTPDLVTPSSGKNVWWKCSFCGNEWQTKVNSRYNGNNCPSCRMIYHVSFPEKALFYYIKKSFPDTIDNTRFDWLKGQEIDIYIPSLSLAVEYDGDHWHQDTKRDNQKGLLLKEHGIQLFRVREPKCPPINDGSIVIHITELEKNYSHMNEAIMALYKEFEIITDHVIIPDVDVLRDNTQILGTYQKYKKDNLSIIVFSRCVKNLVLRY